MITHSKGRRHSGTEGIYLCLRDDSPKLWDRLVRESTWYLENLYTRHNAFPVLYLGILVSAYGSSCIVLHICI